MQADRYKKILVSRDSPDGTTPLDTFLPGCYLVRVLLNARERCWTEGRQFEYSQGFQHKTITTDAVRSLPYVGDRNAISP